MNKLFDPIFKNYANFKGRTSKSEFWPFALVYLLLAFGIRVLALVSDSSESGQAFISIKHKGRDE